MRHSMTEGPVQEFPIGRSKARHGFVIAAIGILVGLGILLFADKNVTDSHWMGAVLVAMGIGVGVHAWRTGRMPGAHLRVGAAGVYFREWGATVPWSEIADVYQSGSRLQPFITLRIADPERLMASLSEEEVRRLKRNRLWKKPELRIPYSAVEASRDEILAAIQNGMTDREPPVA